MLVPLRAAVFDFLRLVPLALNGNAPNNNENSTFTLIVVRLSLRSCLCERLSWIFGLSQKRGFAPTYGLGSTLSHTAPYRKSAKKTTLLQKSLENQ